MQMKLVGNLPHPLSPQVPFCLFTAGCVSFQTFSSFNDIQSSYYGIVNKTQYV